MHLSERARRTTWAAVIALALLPLNASAGEAAAITQPSQRLKLAFQGPGVIKEVLVKEGERVEVGQVLLREDDRMEQKLLEALKLVGDSPLQVEAAQADFEVKKVVRERVEKMHKQGAGSQAELEEARLNAQIAEIRVKLADQERSQKQLEAGRQEIKVEMMELLSPIDGIVEKLNVGLGEMADPQKPEGACIVVKNDPLWVEIHLRTAQAARLSPGDVLPVRYNDEEQAQWHDAKIIYFAPVADAASGTQLVRLELPNPQNRASGKQVTVKLPAAVAAAGDRHSALANP